MSTLRTDYGQKTVQEFIYLFQHGQLNLSPGFQRDSVWSKRDRKKLIESILNQYPVPSIFLYKRNDNGNLVYDVLDGKQRLESILMFQGLRWFRGMGFSAEWAPNGAGDADEWDWRKIERRGLAYRLMEYKFQTVEVSADDLAAITRLFVLINSTGKRLTGAEQRNARYFHTPFLRNAERLARKFLPYFRQYEILSEGQISRMKHVEVTCELMASFQTRGIIDKKKALDNIIGGEPIDGRSLKRCMRQLVRTMNRAKRMFPDLRETRFANAADFYSLMMLLHEMENEGCILSDRARNRQAQKLLVWLSNGVDMVRQQARKMEGARPDQRLFKDYLLTVQADTDSRAQRLRRAEFLRGVLGGLFQKKDGQRGFTLEQRRLIWHSEDQKRCPKCKRALTWDNFTIDHIKAHSRGGDSTLKNAGLLCLSCNSRKGAR